MGTEMGIINSSTNIPNNRGINNSSILLKKKM